MWLRQCTTPVLETGYDAAVVSHTGPGTVSPVFYFRTTGTANSNRTSKTGTVFSDEDCGTFSGYGFCISVDSCPLGFSSVSYTQTAYGLFVRK